MLAALKQLQLRWLTLAMCHAHLQSRIFDIRQEILNLLCLGNGLAQQLHFSVRFLDVH